MTRLLMGLCVVLMATTGWALFRSEIHKGRAERAIERAERFEAQLTAERAKVRLLRDEMESDNEVDLIPDSGLIDAVPDSWLLNPAPR